MGKETEDKKDIEWDKLLNIRTTGRDDSHSDQYRYPYEPTPYSVLERLVNSGYIGKKNTVIDYGCGKGRVDFFLANQTRSHTIGIEYDQQIFEKAVLNKEKAVSSEKVSFMQADAVEYKVPEQVDCCFFFNPFSLDLLKKVMARILESYYAQMRKMQLFFYYPSDEYISYLMTVDELLFADEIDCRDLFPGDNTRERIVVFEIGGILERDLTPYNILR